MTTQHYAIFIVVLLVFIFIRDLYYINTRILCRFTRIDKSVKKKWASSKTRRIEFDKGWYYIITQRIKFDTMFFGLLPLKVLEFNWHNKYPVNPDSGKADDELPEERKNLDKTEDIEALNRGTQKSYGSVKGGVLGGGWLPIMLVVGVVASLYFSWQLMGKVDMLGQAINVLQELAMK